MITIILYDIGVELEHTLYRCLRSGCQIKYKTEELQLLTCLAQHDSGEQQLETVPRPVVAMPC